MVIVAMDAGATQTAAGLYHQEGHLLAELEGEPANPVACGWEESARVLAGLARALLGGAAPALVAAAVAGAATREQQHWLAANLCARLGCPKAVVSTDLHAVLHASAPSGPALLALSGTGSAVLVRTAQGGYRKFGGRGPRMGDAGSATHIALAALAAAARAVDGLGPRTSLPARLAEAAEVDTFDALPAWAAAAGKARLAALARVAGHEAERGDETALNCIREQATALANLVAGAHRVAALPAGAPILTCGGVFGQSALFTRHFAACLAKAGLPAPLPAPVQGHAAAHALAAADNGQDWATWCEHKPAGPAEALAATERLYAAGRPLDTMSATELVRHMNDADQQVAPAVRAQAPAIAAAVETAAATLRDGGRIIYVGAGTSGRLGMLDAAECPPTFGVGPDRVLSLMAGGAQALRRSIEGAEDDSGQARADMAELRPDRLDTVIGITASGRTPYVRAALGAAAAAGARTVLVCCNPDVANGAEAVISLDTGPEVLAGSTRLKAGTATKLVLNTISTGAMALGGLVYGPYMVGMRPVNAKLRARAVRMVSTLAGLPECAANEYLDAADGKIPVAVLMGKRGMDRPRAEAALRAAGGVLRRALERP